MAGGAEAGLKAEDFRCCMVISLSCAQVRSQHGELLVPKLL